MTGDKNLAKKDAENRDLEKSLSGIGSRTRYKTETAAKRTTRARTRKNLVGSRA